MQLFTRVSPYPDSLSFPLSFFSFQPPCRALYCTTVAPCAAVDVSGRAGGSGHALGAAAAAAAAANQATEVPATSSGAKPPGRMAAVRKTKNLSAKCYRARV